MWLTWKEPDFPLLWRWSWNAKFGEAPVFCEIRGWLDYCPMVPGDSIRDLLQQCRHIFMLFCEVLGFLVRMNITPDPGLTPLEATWASTTLETMWAWWTRADWCQPRHHAISNERTCPWLLKSRCKSHDHRIPRSEAIRRSSLLLPPGGPLNSGPLREGLLWHNLGAKISQVGGFHPKNLRKLAKCDGKKAWEKKLLTKERYFAKSVHQGTILMSHGHPSGQHLQGRECPLDTTLLDRLWIVSTVGRYAKGPFSISVAAMAAAFFCVVLVCMSKIKLTPFGALLA
jgi:hypothetical protein